jgi:hypothetical protein
MLKETDFKTHRLGDIGRTITVAERNSEGYDYYIIAHASEHDIWSREIMKYYGISEGIGYNVLLMRKPVYYSTNIKVCCKGLSIKDNEYATSLKEETQKYDNIFLKLNANGKEHNWILSRSKHELKHFKQMYITFYNIHYSDHTNFGEQIKMMNKILITHTIIYTHEYKDLIDICYIRKDRIESDSEDDLKSVPLKRVRSHSW